MFMKSLKRILFLSVFLCSSSILFPYFSDIVDEKGDAREILRLMIIKKDLEAIQKFVQKFLVRDKKTTALHYAAANGYTELIQPLLDLGFDIEAKDNCERTPLMLASSCYSKPESVLLLLKAGANVDARNKNDSTALHYAAINGKADAISFLIDYKANIKARNAGGDTPLHNARTPAAIALLYYGADIEAKNNLLETPIHCASDWGTKETVLVFIKAKADINAKDSNNQTPLMRAAKRVRPEIVEVLLAAGAIKPDATEDLSNVSREIKKMLQLP
jgi:ankyrin repeat protein